MIFWLIPKGEKLTVHTTVCKDCNEYKAYLDIDKSSMFGPETADCVQSTFHFCTDVNPQGCTVSSV